MNNSYEFAGYDENGRSVHAAFFGALDAFEPPSDQPYVLAVFADTEDMSTAELFSFSERALKSGAVFVACWGTGAERFEGRCPCRS